MGVVAFVEWAQPNLVALFRVSGSMLLSIGHSLGAEAQPGLHVLCLSKPGRHVGRGKQLREQSRSPDARRDDQVLAREAAERLSWSFHLRHVEQPALRSQR